MVHNGIEYGLMQAYAEGFELMKAAGEFDLDLHEIAGDLALRIGGALVAARADRAGPRRRRHAVEDPAATSTTPARAAGRCRRPWTGPCPLPVITASLYARFVSREPDAYQAKLLAAMRNQFGGHAIHAEEPHGS